MLKALDSPLRPKRVVVFGASGFVGQELVKSLKKQDQPVLALGSKDVDLAGSAALDVLPKLLNADDSIVFAPAITPDKSKDLNAFLKNMKMGENICKHLQKHPCQHLVYISSDGVYGFESESVSESTPCDSGTLYGHMHRTRELMLASLAAEAGFGVAVLRPCAVYGALDTHNSYGPNRFLRSALNEKKIPLFGNGEERRDHIYIDDFVEAIELSLFHRIEGTSNVCSGTSYAFMEVAKAIQEIAGPGITIESKPRAAGPITHRRFEATALQKRFPDFETTSLQDGLRKTLKGLQEKK